MANKKQRKRKLLERKGRQAETKPRGSSSEDEPSWYGWGAQTPWDPVKTSYTRFTFDEFASLNQEELSAVYRKVAENAGETFQREYFRIGEWFRRYDALYLLSYCAYYFLSHPEGVDPESKGWLDFYPHYLEVLQAFALTQPRCTSFKSLCQEAGDLLKLMQTVGDAALYRNVDDPARLSDEEKWQQTVLYKIRHQTMAVRNWAYPQHMLRVIHALGDTVSQDFLESHHVDLVQFVDSLFRLAQLVDDRVNQHRDKVRKFFSQHDHHAVVSSYVKSFPDESDCDADALFDLAGRQLKSLKAMLIHRSDMKLPDAMIFTLDDVANAYGKDVDKQALKGLLEKISIGFGDLGGLNMEHVMLDNPVWKRPFIQVNQEIYFSPILGCLVHYVPLLFDHLISLDSTLERKFLRRKAQYLEDELESLFKESFPDGKLYRGSIWDDGAGSRGENDLTVVIGCVAIVVEAKSGRISPSANRGGVLRLKSTVRDLVDKPAEQAHRFISVLREAQGTRTFATKDGSENCIDISQVRYFVPLTVTLEQFGLVNNVRDLVESGISERALSDLAPVVGLTDLMVIFDVLDLQSERVHYLARRREIEIRARWHGSELDLIAFYLQYAFNIDEAEFSGETIFFSISSKQLDPYFFGHFLGVAVDKPQLALTPWWRDIIKRLEYRRPEHWLEMTLLLLNFPYLLQQKFERAARKVGERLLNGKLKHRHNYVGSLTSQPERRFFVAGYPYSGVPREERITFALDSLDSSSAQNARGALCIGLDVHSGDPVYSMIVLKPEPDLFDYL